MGECIVMSFRFFFFFFFLQFSLFAYDKMDEFAIEGVVIYTN